MEITKVQLIDEIHNCYVHNWYYLVYARMFNPQKTLVRRFRYVVWFDNEDIGEFYGYKTITKRMLREYAGEIAGSLLPSGLKWGDAKGVAEFRDTCNATIERYNRTHRD